ncbi:DUF624 domain-containing protein [Ruminococcus sp. YRD2003]|uniref:DUF624 domain-containing protein n=1 Tax=Ruminococcus sp. YRD2003 TaxID=1452313 RepID=UPI00296FA210
MLILGLFSSNYESAGAGIAKNAPKKEGIALFFDIFFRKFWLMIGLNILFFLFTIPLWATLPVMYYVSNEKVSLIIVALLLVVFAVSFGPAVAGISKVIRLFLLGRHSFIVRDFFKGFKQNFGKACLIGILDIVAVLSAYAGYNVYPAMAVNYDSKIFYVPLVITFSVVLVILMMNYYIFLMMTATDLSIKNLIKNSFALAFVAMKQNIIATVGVALYAAFLAVLFVYLMPVFMLMIPLFSAVPMWFIVCFNSYPVIQKYVITPYYESRGEVNPELTDGSEDIEEETIFEDMGGKEKPIEKPVEKRKKGKGRHIS